MAVAPRSVTCLALFGAAIVFLGGCTSWREYVHNGFKVGPNYSKPPAPVVENVSHIPEGEGI